MPSFSAAEDLFGRFQLQGAYDKYVKPHALPVDQWQSSPKPVSDKGKGRERDGGDVDVNMDTGSPGDLSGNPDEATKLGKKRKKEGSYKHLIKAIVGKHSMKKDNYLVETISVPPKQKADIRTFDERTQNDAFWVSLEGLKGYNIHALIPETDQAREDKKRRKEAKKAEKERARLMALSAGGGDGSLIPEQGVQPTQVPTPMTNGAPTPAAANASLIASASSTTNGIDAKSGRMTNHPPNSTQQRSNGKVSTPINQRPSTPVHRQASAQNMVQRPSTPQQRQSQPSQQQQSQQSQQQNRPQPTPQQSQSQVRTQNQTQSRTNQPAQSHLSEVGTRGVKRERPDTPLSHQQLHSASQVYPNHHGMGMGHSATAKKRRLESATAVR